MRESFLKGQDLARESGKKLMAYELVWNKPLGEGTRENPRRPKVADDMSGPCSWETHEALGCVFVSAPSQEHDDLKTKNKQLTLDEVKTKANNNG